MTKKQFFLFILLGFGFIIASSITIWYFNQKGKRSSEDTIHEKSVQELRHSYINGCAGNPECKSCKENVKCLKCQHDCYNRHGDIENKDNPYYVKLMGCYEECYIGRSRGSPNVDFKVAPTNLKEAPKIRNID
tara:strand:+ start:506 stop:904 length:399 start_codon:yes stop_codon:yes gene_type:complete